MSTTGRTPSRVLSVVANSIGSPPSSHLHVMLTDAPTIKTPTDILIRVVASSINLIDTKLIAGELSSLIPLTTPYKVGYDVCGIVTQVGESVKKFKQGDAVYGRVSQEYMGTMTQMAVAPESCLAMKPSSISFDEAASIPLVGLTALQSIRDTLQVKGGDKLLILGGSGGVGSFAIQLAKMLGAYVITTATGMKLAKVKELGADQVIDYKREDYTKMLKDIDAIFDTTGDTNGFSVLKSKGKFVSIVSSPTLEGVRKGGIEPSATGKAWVTAASAPVLAKAALMNVEYHFVWMKPLGEELEEITKWVDEGRIKPVVDRVFPLEKAKEGFEYLAEKGCGKVVIHVQDQ